MAEILQLNKRRGLVKFSEDELAELNLLRWIRTSFKGIGKKGLIEETPFEEAAAKLYVEKFPSCQIFVADKCVLNSDNSVSVFLIVYNEPEDPYFNTNDTDIVITKTKSKKAFLHRASRQKYLTVKAAKNTQLLNYFLFRLAAFPQGHEWRVSPSEDPNKFNVSFNSGNSSKFKEKQFELDPDIESWTDVNGKRISVGDVVASLSMFSGGIGQTNARVNFLDYDKLIESSNYPGKNFLSKDTPFNNFQKTMILLGQVYREKGDIDYSRIYIPSDVWGEKYAPIFGVGSYEEFVKQLNVISNATSPNQLTNISSEFLTRQKPSADDTEGQFDGIYSVDDLNSAVDNVAKKKNLTQIKPASFLNQKYQALKVYLDKLDIRDAYINYLPAITERKKNVITKTLDNPTMPLYMQEALYSEINNSEDNKFSLENVISSIQQNHIDVNLLKNFQELCNKTYSAEISYEIKKVLEGLEKKYKDVIQKVTSLNSAPKGKGRPKKEESNNVNLFNYMNLFATADKANLDPEQVDSIYNDLKIAYPDYYVDKENEENQSYTDLLFGYAEIIAYLQSLAPKIQEYFSNPDLNQNDDLASQSLNELNITEDSKKDSASSFDNDINFDITNMQEAVRTFLERKHNSNPISIKRLLDLNASQVREGNNPYFIAGLCDFLINKDYLAEANISLGNTKEGVPLTYTSSPDSFYTAYIYNYVKKQVGSNQKSYVKYNSLNKEEKSLALDSIGYGLQPKSAEEFVQNYPDNDSYLKLIQEQWGVLPADKKIERLQKIADLNIVEHIHPGKDTKLHKDTQGLLHDKEYLDKERAKYLGDDYGLGKSNNLEDYLSEEDALNMYDKSTIELTNLLDDAFAEQSVFDSGFSKANEDKKVLVKILGFGYYSDPEYYTGPKKVDDMFDELESHLLANGTSMEETTSILDEWRNYVSLAAIEEELKLKGFDDPYSNDVVPMQEEGFRKRITELVNIIQQGGIVDKSSRNQYDKFMQAINQYVDWELDAYDSNIQTYVDNANEEAQSLGNEYLAERESLKQELTAEALEEIPEQVIQNFMNLGGALKSGADAMVLVKEKAQELQNKRLRELHSAIYNNNNNDKIPEMRYTAEDDLNESIWAYVRVLHPEYDLNITNVETDKQQARIEENKHKILVPYQLQKVDANELEKLYSTETNGGSFFKDIAKIKNKNSLSSEDKKEIEKVKQDYIEQYNKDSLSVEDMDNDTDWKGDSSKLVNPKPPQDRDFRGNLKQMTPGYNENYDKGRKTDPVIEKNLNNLSSSDSEDFNVELDSDNGTNLKQVAQAIESTYGSDGLKFYRDVHPVILSKLRFMSDSVRDNFFSQDGSIQELAKQKSMPKEFKLKGKDETIKLPVFNQDFLKEKDPQAASKLEDFTVLTLLQDIYDMNQQSFEDKYKKIVIPAFMQELLAQKELLNKQQQTKNAKVVAYRIAQCLREISEKKEARLLSAYIKYGKLNNPNEDSTFEKEELDVMSEIISLAEEVQTMHKEDYSEQKEIALLEEMASIIDSLISEHSCQNDSYKVIELEASPISMLDDKFEKVLKHQISKISTLIGSSQADQEFMEGEIYDDGNKNDTSSITGNRIS